MGSVTIISNEQPIGKGRPRFTRTGRVYTPVRTKRYEQRLALAAQAAMNESGLDPIDTPCKIEILAQFEVPKSWPKYKKLDAYIDENNIRPGMPDIDNVIKAALDAWNKIVFTDDKLVYHLVTEKRYGQPCLVATVTW